MGASVDELVEATHRCLVRADESVSILHVISSAIISKGITNKADIKRLSQAVLDAIELKKKKAKKTAFDDYSDDVRRAALGFTSWTLAQNRLPKELQDPFRFKVNYKKLTRYVYMYVESAYAHLPKAERPDVYEVEACLRSNNAKKAAVTRKAKREKAQKPLSPGERGKLAAKKLREQQQDLF
jgi:hypothetical protein